MKNYGDIYESCPYCEHGELEVNTVKGCFYLSCGKCECSFPITANLADSVRLVKSVVVPAEMRKLVVRI